MRINESNNTLSRWIIKKIPVDFCVEEVQFPAFFDTNSPSCTIFHLQKFNLTTIQVIEILAKHTGIPCDAWGYAGLKDEDGITSQYISVTRILSVEEIEEFQCRINTDSLLLGATIRLEFSRYASKALIPGELLGNAFSVVLRDVSTEDMYWFIENQKKTISFINYYDSQRFCFPGFPELSHTIGMHLNNREFEKAYHNYIISCPHDQQLQRLNNEAKESFFERLSPIRRAFYLSSWESSKWNTRISEIVTKFRVDTTSKYENGSQSLTFVMEPLFFSHQEKFSWSEPYMAYRAISNEIIANIKHRQVICTTNFTIVEHDESSIRISFFLPMGNYATMLIKQLAILCSKRLAV